VNLDVNLQMYCPFAETKNLVIEFIKSAQRDFPNDWNAFYNELPQEIAANLQQIFV